MRISDWSSDVCSSDLRVVDLRCGPGVAELTGSLVIDRARGLGFCGLSARCDTTGAAAMHAAFGLRATLLFDLAAGRSEERRVGKECVRPFRFRWWPVH